VCAGGEGEERVGDGNENGLGVEAFGAEEVRSVDLGGYMLDRGQEVGILRIGPE